MRLAERVNLERPIVLQPMAALLANLAALDLEMKHPLLGVEDEKVAFAVPAVLIP